VHDTHHVTLRADGHEAPAQPGYVTGWKEMALVDSKDPKAKPLPMSKMMIHHLLYTPRGPTAPRPEPAGARRASSVGVARSTR
jgi:hypothetical protein